MKRLFALTALIEAPVGLALLTVPAVVVRLLLGAEITGAGIPLGRVAGAALIALGAACWWARDDTHGRAASGLVAAMICYNFAVAAILGVSGLGSGPRGVALWPAVVLHLVMAVSCVAGLRLSPVKVTK